MLETATLNPPQHQNQQPGIEAIMFPHPEYIKPDYISARKLEGKVAVITGGDSGIGRAVAIAFAKEGADIAIQYLNETIDAEKTKNLIEAEGRNCLIIKGNLNDEDFCLDIIKQTVKEYGQLDIVVNNAAEQFPQEHFEDITSEQLEDTFRVNVFSMFYVIQAALPYLKEGAKIINTASVTAYRGSPNLVDYSATKSAIVGLTRSLSKDFIERGIHVNAVAPGPIWTPLIPATFDEDKVKSFGAEVPMKRPGQPSEVAPCYVFLASNDASYMSGQVLHPNGGEVVNG